MLHFFSAKGTLLITLDKRLKIELEVLKDYKKNFKIK